MTAGSASNVAIVQDVMRLMSEFRFDEAAAHLHDDVIVDCPFQAFHQGPLRRGKALAAAGFGFIPMIFSKFHLVIDEIYDCPEQSTVVFELHSDGIFGAGGAHYENRYVMVFGFRDGKIILWREHFDPDVMNRAMAFMLDFD